MKVGPNYRRPVVPVGEDWIESADDSVAVSPERLHDWWRVFKDPTLDRLIEAAYQQNLPLRTIGLRVLEARAQRSITAANLFPQSQRFFKQYTRTQRSQTTELAGGPRVISDWQSGFDLSWEIDVWGRVRRAIEFSDAAIDAEIEAYDDVLVTLIGDVAATYIELRAIDERLELAEANIRIQLESLRVAKVQLDEKEVSELDVRQAEANVATTRASIPALKLARRQALDRLAILLGTAPINLEPVLRNRGWIPDAPSEVVVGLPAELLRRRPDIRNAERVIAQQSAQIGIAEAELYPQFVINGEIKLNSSQFGNLFNSRSTAGTISPGFRWNILNYGRLVNNIRVQELRFQQLITQYEDVVVRAQSEVEDAMALFLRSKEEATELNKAAKASVRSVELVTTQYKEGEVPFNQVFVLQSNLVATQDQLVVARANVAIGLTQVYRALGGGWQLRLETPYQAIYPLPSIAESAVEDGAPEELPIPNPDMAEPANGENGADG